MKKLTLPILSVCTLALFACHKDHGSGPSTSTSTKTDTAVHGPFNIHLVAPPYIGLDTAIVKFEIIFSETGGKILMDTIVPARTPITATLSTNATLVDLTTIYYRIGQNGYVVSTYKGVNPSSWTGAYYIGYQVPTGSPTSVVQDTLTYTNLPNGNYVAATDENLLNYYQNQTIPKTATAIGFHIPGNYTYLLCEPGNLFKLFQPSGSNETIDCTTMDTAATASYSPSPYYAFSNATIFGYTDSTNLNSLILLYEPALTATTGLPQLVYPTRNIQNYSAIAQFTHNLNELVTSYSYGTTINTNVTYPDPNAYTVTTDNHPGSFAVNWHGIKPSYYSTFWSTTTVVWNIYASPDSSTLSPLALLTNQKPRMLQGQDLTKLFLGAFSYETVQNFDYAGFLNFGCDSNQVRQHPVTSAIRYMNDFY